jgi:hypothetical protein
MEQFEEKRKKLNTLKRVLRRKFVGINSIIDEILENLEAWYLMPELLTRPTIINLWGTTGVGKTELIDTIAKELGFESNYAKIDLESARHYSLITVMSRFTITSGQPSILFFDEFQNFRTIDRQGNEIKGPYKVEFWELLNSGTITTKRELREISEEIPSSEEDNTLVKDTWIGRSEADLLRIKSILGLNVKPKEIESWTVKRLRREVSKCFNNPFHKLDCTKSLIVIAGNLDEAYKFSDQVDEVDLDADDYHNLSKKVSFLTIKRALTKRFKPEQIARLGNTHIVYPCLSKAAFKELVKRNLKKSCTRFTKVTGVKIELQDSIHRLVYENGVFPTQGARPIFTTIREIVENNLPKIAIFCLENKLKSITVDYSEEDRELVISPSPRKGNKRLKIQYEGRVHGLKKRKTQDERAIVAVHEAGHAVIAATLFKTAPEKISVDTVSGGKAGYVKNPTIFGSKAFLEREVMVMLAGRCAEELIFESENVSVGAGADIESATELICKMIRHLGLGDTIGRSGSSSELGAPVIITEERNISIESKLQDLYQKTRDEVRINERLILKLANKVMSDISLDQTQLVEFFKENGLEVETAETVTPNYHEILLKKLEE